jgi:hypothetical protein
MSSSTELEPIFDGIRAFDYALVGICNALDGFALRIGTRVFNAPPFSIYEQPD